MVGQSVTEADATDALQATARMYHPLSAVDDCVVVYLANTLAGFTAEEDGKDSVHYKTPEYR